MVILRKWIPVIGIIACGLVLTPDALDRALTSRHLIWCLMVIALVVCTKEVKIGKGHLFMFGYLGLALVSVFFATNKYEWLNAILRIVLLVCYVSVVEIDRELISKTIIVLGTIFVVAFWLDYSQVGIFDRCRGLMRQRNTWATAQFLVIPFCYYAVTKNFWRIFAIFVALAMALNIILLNSRCVILAVVSFCFIISIMNKKIR